MTYEDFVFGRAAYATASDKVGDKDSNLEL